MATAATRDCDLLIADDNKDDLFLLQWGFHKAGFAPALHFASNGVEVIAYFKRCLESVAGRPELPTVVVLDIKMPLMDGHQVLAWIRSQPALDGLAVCMLSDSSMDSDLATAEKNKANRYWVKPTELTQYVGLADSLKSMLHELHLPA